MKPLFSKGPSPIARLLVLSVLSLTVAGIFIYTDWFASLKNQATDVAAPFYWVSDIPAKVEDWADNRVMSRSRLQQENESLRTELLIHKRKLQQMASLAAENVRLRQLLNSAEMIEDRVIIAELIGVSPDPLVHKVIVNRGSNHGVYIGQPLLDANGLMGQVVQVGALSSQVLLITDTTHALPVQINRTGVRLIAEGLGRLDELALRYVPNTTDIEVGDLLVSSGLGQRFPAGYPVAEVVEVQRDPGKAFATVMAKPKAELNRSRHVLLVFDMPPSEGL
ncbi:rod shape-determining protein MreC [Saccharophagus degradans]|uniref:rod shape-determining protein MreC n=1 Tax=Saccharophagus degradans TaxID=86304 RepID=UPI001DE7EA8A|nr:rod shape-determining protein MreC [Saccharophagus degradans]